MKLIVAAAIVHFSEAVGLISETKHNVSQLLLLGKADPEGLGEVDGPGLEIKEQYYEEHTTCVRVKSGSMKKQLPPKPPLDPVIVKPKDDEAVTPDACYEACREARCIYFAMNGDDKCYCFDRFVGQELDLHECPNKCAGDTSKECGGGGDKYSMHLMLAWIPKPPVLKCKQPEIPGAHTTCESGSDEVGERSCEIACAPGHTLTQNTLICDTVLGKWAGVAICAEIKCGPPPEVPYAASTCLHASAASDGKCDIKCQSGADLKENSLRCTSLPDHPDTVGFYDGEAMCAPKSCGVPPKRPNTLSIDAEALYPMQVRYSCDHGFTLNAKVTGVISFFTSCREDGKLAPIDDKTKCKPVECGEPPKLPHAVRIPDASAEIQKFLSYPDRASYRCDTGYSIDGFGHVKEVEVSCEASGELTHLLPCKPTVCGLAVSLPNSKLLAEDKTAIINYGESLNYKCDVGHEKPDGTTETTVSCKDNGAFSVSAPCKPVVCGLPPSVENALVASAEIIFPTVITYSCGMGHTINGDVTGEDHFHTTCQADKSFTALSECQPVRCPAIPDLSHGKFDDEADLNRAVFEGIFEYSCDDGFSLDATEFGGAKTATVKCLETGEFSTVQACIPINDCIGHSCGPFGVCVDHHMNYTCDCQSGFTMTMTEEELVCGNVNDCGPMMCGEGGDCEDLVNDYTCNCRDGFEMTTQDDGEKVCSRVICGEPPEVNNTKEFNSIKLVFQDVHQYTCMPGFSLDGDRAGVKDFTIQCLASATNTGVSECKPVSCGQPPAVENAEIANAEVVYGGAAQYTCKTGYTLDGKADGIPMFETKCGTSGHFRERLVCQRVSCGGAPLIQMAHVDSEPLLFGDEARYRCSDGYSRDPDDHTAKAFTGKCQADGSVELTKRCFPVKCKIPELPTGLLGEYFYLKAGFKHDSGMPMLNSHADLERIDTNFDIKSTDLAFEGVANRDNFAIRWTGQLLITKPGLYEFSITSDDGSCLYLDGLLSSDVGLVAGSALLGQVRRIGGVSGLRPQARQTGFAFVSTAVARHRAYANRTGRMGAHPVHTGVRVLENGGVHAMQEKTGSRLLAAGPHEVYIEYFEKLQGAGFIWKYKGPDTNNQWHVVPDHRLEPPSVTYAGPPTIAGEGADAATSSANFPQNVQYMCKKGFTVDGQPESSGELTASCDAEGVLQGVQDCVPVECARGNLPSVDKSRLVSHQGRISYGDVLNMTCDPGYAVEMTLTDKLLLVDNGDLAHSFGLECLASGAFSAPKACKNIDDCQGHSCGAHGSCVDGIQDYSCDCQEGFEMQETNGEKVCGNVDDCGPEACGEHGVCFDLVNAYRCECFAGYEAQNVGEEIVCKPKVCPTVDPLPHTSMTMPVTLKFPQSVQIECAEGHSIDGSTVSESGVFEVACGSDGSNSAAISCKPVECGFAPAVFQVATGPAPLKKFKFGEVAQYVCAEGHTMDGTVDGPKDKSVNCGADGLFPPVNDCMPVSCGIPDRLGHGMVTSSAVAFPGAAIYTCDNGYTLSNENPTKVSFSRKCQADGNYEQVPQGLLRPMCTACKIGDDDVVKIQLHICASTGAGTKDGGSFQLMEGGSWTPDIALPKNMDKKQVVSIEVPVTKWPTKIRVKNGGADKWCASGINIIHCARTISALGQDSWFENVLDYDAAHTYDVPPALESTHLDFGASTVAQDNLAGAGPGTGDAEIRYAKVALVKGKDVDLVLTASRIRDGGLLAESRKEGKLGQLTLEVGTKADVTFEFQDSSSQEPVMVPQFELAFYDLDRGLRSTKVIEAKDYSIDIHSRDAEMHMAPAEQDYTSFTASHRGAACTATTDPEDLSEVSCEGLTVKRINRAIMLRYIDTTKFRIRFYARCDEGECHGGRKFLFSGRSDALAAGSTMESLQAVRVSCGEPAVVQKASFGLPGARKFGQVVTYDCESGYTVDGTAQGLADFSTTCQADGTYTPLLSDKCVKIMFSVQGKTADATNMHKIAGATIKLVSGSTEVEVTSSNAGVFTLPAVPPGAATLTVSKGGFITGTKALTVVGPINAGEGADFSLSPTLPNDGWRVVLNWKKEPYDLDSWVLFPGTTCKMYWARRNVRCGAFNNVQAILDVDDTRSYGPETTTFLDLDKCKSKPNCKLVFKVHNYSRKPGWAASGAVVKVYNGDREVATYTVGQDGHTNGDGSGANQFWAVFQLDGLTDTIKPCTSDACAD